MRPIKMVVLLALNVEGELFTLGIAVIATNEQSYGVVVCGLRNHKEKAHSFN